MYIYIHTYIYHISDIYIYISYIYIIIYTCICRYIHIMCIYIYGHTYIHYNFIRLIWVFLYMLFFISGDLFKGFPIRVCQILRCLKKKWNGAKDNCVFGSLNGQVCFFCVLWCMPRDCRVEGYPGPF